MPPPPPPATRPAREPAAPAPAADGVHLSGEPAGEAGARERSAGRSRASPGRFPPALELRPGGASDPAQPARRPGRCSAARAARRRDRPRIKTPGASPAPRRRRRRRRLDRDPSARGVAGEAGAAVGEPQAAAGEKPPPLRALLLLLLPLPPPLRTWSPLSCRRRRRLALSSARRGRG